MQAIVTNRVAWSVSQSDLVSPAKMAQSMEMPFGMKTGVGPRNHVSDGVDIPHGKGQFVKYRETLRSSVQKRLN